MMVVRNVFFVVLGFLLSVLILLSGFVLVSSYAVDIEEYLPRGIVRITPEGDVEGTDRLSRNGNVYTLMSDMVYSDVGSNFISIECDGVIFDGNEKTLRGANNGIAIVIYGSDITVKNTRIVNFGTGIEVGIHTEASNNRIVDNYFETRWWCISLRGDKQFVSGNTFNANNGNAIEFWTRDTTFVDNAFVNCGLSFNSYDVSNVVLNNSINGKPLVVLEGQSNQVVDGAAQVILVNCRGMVVQNVVDIGLNKPIQLYGVTDSVITKCESHISLVNSDNNLLVDNEFSKTGGTWQSAAVLLSNSHSNTVMQNVVVGVNSCGIIVTGSNYNKIEKNSIKSTSISKLDNCAGMTLGGYKNYVYENDIVCEEFGLNLSGEHNVFFKNNVSHGKCSVYLSNALYNDVLGNNLSGASESAVCLVSSDFNNFVWNNFIDNSKVYEIHETYWMTFTNFSYYAEYNKWDNGKEGNYWSDYTGQDTNGYGIGKTVYMVYENFTDNYPLTGLYDISKIQIALEPEVGSSIELPQLPITTSTPTATGTSEGNNSKAFPTTAVIVAVISVAVIVAAVVSVVFLKRAKNEDRTKIV